MNENQPILSVIIPAYNAEKYLGACLDSILQQKIKSIEILVVEAGSTDGTAEVMREYAGKHPEIRPIFPQKRLFASAARNIALSLVRGKYFAYCDADDTIPKGAYREMLRVAERYNADLVLGNFNYIDSGSVVSTVAYDGFTGLERCFDKCNVSACNKLYKASFAGHLRFEDDLQSAEDALYSIDVFRLHPNIAYTNNVVYNYMIKRADDDENETHDEFYNASRTTEDCLRAIEKGFEKPFEKWQDLWAQLYVDYTAFMFHFGWEKIGNVEGKKHYFERIQQVFRHLQNVNPVCDYAVNDNAGRFHSKFGLDYISFMSLNYEQYIFAQLLNGSASPPPVVQTVEVRDTPAAFIQMCETGKVGMRMILRAIKGWLHYKFTRRK